MNEERINFQIKDNHLDKNPSCCNDNGSLDFVSDLTVNVNTFLIKKNIPNNIKKNICSLNTCNKRLTLVESDIKCKCNKIFCLKHRYSLYHNCDFDYKKEHKEQLGKKLEKVINDKIKKI